VVKDDRMVLAPGYDRAGTRQAGRRRYAFALRGGSTTKAMAAPLVAMLVDEEGRLGCAGHDVSFLVSTGKVVDAR
jgi:CubicO group peptidase (beta-lactamase class C family)